ncbi:site-specific tyrosine recombinase XerC [Lentilactobacillus parabuchneri]|nr:site-specific tyrosine recombinase XerC [Lentilactobacillus parabuchneri]
MVELTKDQKNINWFLKYLKSDRNYSVDTIQAYQQAISDFVDFIAEVPEDQKQLTEVDAFDVESFLTHLYEKQYV